MTADLAQKVFDDLKTHTRRVINPQPPESWMNRTDWSRYYVRGVQNLWLAHPEDPARKEIKCPFGKPGDRLFVKETYFAYGQWKKDGATRTGAQKWRFEDLTGTDFQYKYLNDPPQRLASGSREEIGWHKRSALFMPRRAARSILEVKEIRVERLQDISAADAEAEGINLIDFNCFENYLVGEDWIYNGQNQREMHALEDPVMSFASLFDKINGGRGFTWLSNPWIWVIVFKKIKGE